MIRHLVLACALVFTSAAAWAHGTSQHVLGTVTAIDATHIEVKTQQGKMVDVKVNKQTHFKEKGNPKSTEPPAIGDRVVIEATKDNKVLRATEIHFSAAKKWRRLHQRLRHHRGSVRHGEDSISRFAQATHPSTEGCRRPSLECSRPASRSFWPS